MKTSSSEIITLLKSRIDNPLYNTSYPIDPSDWYVYRKNGNLPFNLSEPVALYIHIPFCRRICSFCEYSKVILPSIGHQTHYLNTLRKDVLSFITNKVQPELYGLDIGGGTPTALDLPIFEELMHLYRKIISLCNVTGDYEPSIEATFETLTEQKIRAIYAAGIRRISLGMQSSSESVLTPLKRNTENPETMQRVINYARTTGIRKINIDLMYGLPHQSFQSIKNDIETIGSLFPEQVTVYEFRTNQLRTDYIINSRLCYEQYCLLYESLTKLGYYGIFGQNTFSIDPYDKGLSSYLRHRMYDGWQYKGFGVSAQSMSDRGMAYNTGKNSDRLTTDLNSNTFESDVHYALPAAERLAKFIAISGYSGGFSLKTAESIYGDSFERDFHTIIKFLEKEGLIEIEDKRLQLTRRGFRYYGPLLSLFYPR